MSATCCRRPGSRSGQSRLWSTAGLALVARSPADGYMLLLSTSAHAYGATFKSSLPYDPLADFVPIAPLTNQPYVLVASMHLGVSDSGRADLGGESPAQCDQVQFFRHGHRNACGRREAQSRAFSSKQCTCRRAGRTRLPTRSAETVAGRTDYALSPISVARLTSRAPAGSARGQHFASLPAPSGGADAGSAVRTSTRDLRQCVPRTRR